MDMQSFYNQSLHALFAVIIMKKQCLPMPANIFMNLEL